MAELEPLSESGKRYSVAFRRMCNFVAIQATGNPTETLSELALQCFITSPASRISDATDVRRIIEKTYGLRLPLHEIEVVLDKLETAQLLMRPAGTNLVLAVEPMARIQERIAAATDLERYVKEGWAAETRLSAPSISSKDLWDLLQDFLRLAFRQHGMQTVALLDPTVDADGSHAESLASLLQQATDEHLDSQSRQLGRAAVSRFLSDTGAHPDRARYLAQLADGTFNYFSLSIDPELAEKFREELKPLTLFLDTNFLFGILDLHTDSQVDVSNELLSAVARHGLPFTLCYQPVTLREMQRTLDRQTERLRTSRWTRALSRAAAESGCELSGLELKYHRLNSQNSIDVDSFLELYEHVDVLLESKGIVAWDGEEAPLHVRSDVLNDYRVFLEQRSKAKPYESIMHDASALCSTRLLRNENRDSLSAGALLMTCDYSLFGFDWARARQKKRLPCTVMPHLFWQLLRPFVPGDSDFERSFAQTFAIPEFRSLGDGAARACSRLMSLLATYDGLPESTARALLANAPLLQSLRTLRDDREFEREVESAIADQNSMLSEEKAALEVQLETERLGHSQEVDGLQTSLQTAEAALAKLQAETKTGDRTLAKPPARHEEVAGSVAPSPAEGRRIQQYATATTALIALIIAAAFEVVVNLASAPLLTDGKNAYALQALCSILVALCAYRLLKQMFRQAYWTSWLYGMVVVPVILWAIGLLGGPPS